jgi:adenosylhomocysteine nucleosidase
MTDLMETLGLIAALPQEYAPLLRRVGRRERIRLGPFRGYRFQLGNLACLLVESGMGLRHAHDATCALLAAARPRALVSFGIAGALCASGPGSAQQDLRVGDVVIGNGVSLADQGTPGQVLPLASWSEAEQSAASQALQARRVRLVAGTIITTPKLGLVLNPPAGMVYPVLDMETAAVARVAAEQGLPLLALRAISDLSSEPLPFDQSEFTDAELNLSLSKALWAFLRRPRLLPGYLRLARNVGWAAENVAVALFAALGRPTTA